MSESEIIQYIYDDEKDCYLTSILV